VPQIGTHTSISREEKYRMSKKPKKRNLFHWSKSVPEWRSLGKIILWVSIREVIGKAWDHFQV
jgi:hypothetical protein